MGLVIVELKALFRDASHPRAKRDPVEWDSRPRVRGAARKAAELAGRKTAEGRSAASTPSSAANFLVYGWAEEGYSTDEATEPGVEGARRSLLEHPLFDEDPEAGAEAKARFAETFSLQDLSADERPKRACWQGNGDFWAPFAMPSWQVGRDGGVLWTERWVDEFGSGQSMLGNRRFHCAWVDMGYLDGNPGGLGFLECAKRVEAFLREEMPDVAFVGPAEAILTRMRIVNTAANSFSIDFTPQGAVTDRAAVRLFLEQIEGRVMARAQGLALRDAVKKGEMETQETRSSDPELPVEQKKGAVRL